MGDDAIVAAEAPTEASTVEEHLFLRSGLAHGVAGSFALGAFLITFHQVWKYSSFLK
jgi:hypothetical protein